MKKEIIGLSRSLLGFICICLLLTSCKKEETTPSPSAINLSHTSIFEKLPRETNVAIISADLDDNTIKYRLVAGDGDEHNSQFQIKGTILQTTTEINHADGATRNIRISATNDGGTYEETISITINKLDGTYPTVMSPSFQNNQQMPREFGAENGNVSPDLEIMDIPTNAQSMFLAMNDLDDGSSWHWAVWNIPTSQNSIIKNQNWGNGVVEGNNDFGSGYTGPFPPSEHTYKITIYFLDSNIDLAPEDYQTILLNLTGKIIAQTSMTGKYKP